MHYEFTCKIGGERTDKFLALQDTGITRSAAAALIEQGCCLVNGKIAAKNQKLKTGDTVTLDVPEAQPADILPENIPLDIVYEDSDLLVVNKPKGMALLTSAKMAILRFNGQPRRWPKYQATRPSRSEAKPSRAAVVSSTPA